MALEQCVCGHPDDWHGNDLVCAGCDVPGGRGRHAITRMTIVEAARDALMDCAGYDADDLLDDFAAAIRADGQERAEARYAAIVDFVRGAGHAPGCAGEYRPDLEKCGLFDAREAILAIDAIKAAQ